MRTLDIQIRHARPQDAEAISELFKPLVVEYITHEFDAKAEGILLDSMEPSVIAKNLKNDCTYWLAETEIESAHIIAGAIGLRAQTHVFHFFVTQNFHQKGIGKSLWEHVLTQNSAAEFTVNASRYAIKFYEKLGFQQHQPAFQMNGITSFPMIFRQSI